MSSEIGVPDYSITGKRAGINLRKAAVWMLAAVATVAGGKIAVDNVSEYRRIISSPASVYVVPQDASISEISRKLAEGEGSSPFAYEAAIRELNPSIDMPQVPQDTILPAGTKLQVPDANRNGKAGE
ncbi:MAG: hypothetical protein HYW26_03280 [Candidatus Aenigmarchaeota archaeon]|nr:hypothetical protein [Candidatus Aenigmarchaeota archaeon]